MEFRNVKKPQPNSSEPNHFSESNAGHITVKTTSPFLNRRKDSEYTVVEQNLNKSKKHQSASVLNKKLPKDIGSGTSKMLMNQIFGDNNIDEEVFINLNKSYTENNLNQIEKQCAPTQSLAKVPICGIVSYTQKASALLGSNSSDPSKKLQEITRNKNCIFCSGLLRSSAPHLIESSAQTKGIESFCEDTVGVSKNANSLNANLRNGDPIPSGVQETLSNTNCPFVQRQAKKENGEEESIKERYSKVTKNVERLKKQIHETGYVERHSVLESIESKLGTLLKSINSFIGDVKSKTYVKQCYDCRSVYVGSTDNNKSNNIGVTKSDPFGLIRAEKLVCGMIPEKKHVNRQVIERTCGKNIENILIEEMESSNSVKEDFTNTLDGNVGTCSVQISIDIPTKEQSTEVTASFCKAAHRLEDKSVSIEEIAKNSPEGDRCMTIAVNTDPLGLLALLRVSTETVKQLLSYVPNIPYHAYLPMINFPQSGNGHHYVCNICGAAFMRPSLLSDHIRSHYLNKTRDCCVCRHVIDMQSRSPPSLFRCRHCGQRFTRAYCCELHQESCARRQGRTHDVTPSLILLR